jgi:hypothetical protein
MIHAPKLTLIVVVIARAFPKASTIEISLVEWTLWACQTFTSWGAGPVSRDRRGPVSPDRRQAAATIRRGNIRRYERTHASRCSGWQLAPRPQRFAPRRSSFTPMSEAFRGNRTRGETGRSKERLLTLIVSVPTLPGRRTGSIPSLLQFLVAMAERDRRSLSRRNRFCSRQENCRIGRGSLEKALSF